MNMYYEYLGGCTWAYEGLSSMYTISHGSRPSMSGEYYTAADSYGIDSKPLTYLLDLEREGILDGCVLVMIADCFLTNQALSSADSHTLAEPYIQRAIDLEYTPAFSRQPRVRIHGQTDSFWKQLANMLMSGTGDGG